MVIDPTTDPYGKTSKYRNNGDRFPPRNPHELLRLPLHRAPETEFVLENSVSLSILHFLFL